MAVCALTVLDGLGEEATALGGVVVLFLALVLAWLSTHVADRGDHILGTILTVGAHASLIGLGGHDSYASSPPSSEPSEQPDEEPTEEEKQEEGEGRPDGGDDVPGEELLDIQGGRKKVSYVQGDENEEGIEEESEDEATSITVRLKFLNDTEELAVLRPQDTVGLLKSKYFSGREHQIKLIYQGQLLQDPQRSLLSLNITHNSVLHCHISQAQALREASAEENPRAGRGSMLSGGLRSAGLALSTGSLVIPVFVVLLAVVWYFRINYRQLFTAPATISLVGVTVFFSFLIFGMHSR
ncbi:transmembrane and ubiquitin-like domain-containing protein 2 [Pimephales promelas]|uniref:transmembrane and ubiquitin-like domain-containing protein 2 n=1 Tax=Pimephales promelas TaxID=90988 RepID=UPI001955C833|nr:transmembrane and ubiquitin-like domain-containing protein 2 [Pimephales promelas]XP_039543277.1 transmembrane and ubiquitin-like domain-containing protein 2 [Pimephales promelas]KAG1967522.1 transmembrane and ubiquitin-like domain-containing protein 2 isoform a [Pimephales promelas]KAG1967523.1 transmembrane and ubiquitin-like domain-containing protein 2 isoform a [Pimephales promelas]